MNGPFFSPSSIRKNLFALLSEKVASLDRSFLEDKIPETLREKKKHMNGIFKISILILFLVSPILSSSSVLSAEKNGAPPETEVQPESIARMESRIVDKINQVRAKNDLEKLGHSTDLTKVARMYARRMATEDFFSHYGPSGDSVADRLTETGLDYRMVGENIFRSYNVDDPVDAAVKKWMQSPGHRENILMAEFSETGVGIWKEADRYTIVQVFRKPAEEF